MAIGKSVGKSATEIEAGRRNFSELQAPPPKPTSPTYRDLGLGIRDLEMRQDGLANEIKGMDENIKNMMLLQRAEEDKRENASRLLQVVQLELRILRAEISKVDR